MTTAQRDVRINVRADTAQAEKNLRRVDSGMEGIGKAARGMALGVLGGYLSFQALTSGIVRNTFELHAGREEFWRLNDAAQRFSNLLGGALFDVLAELADPLADLAEQVNILMQGTGSDPNQSGIGKFIKMMSDNSFAIQSAILGVKGLTKALELWNQISGNTEKKEVLVDTEQAQKNIDNLASQYGELDWG